MLSAQAALVVVSAAFVLPYGVNAAVSLSATPTTVTAGTKPTTLVLTASGDASLLAGQTLVITPNTAFTLFLGGLSGAGICTSVVDTAGTPTDLCSSNSCCETDGNGVLTITTDANSDADASSPSVYKIVATLPSTSLRTAPTSGASWPVQVEATPVWHSTSGVLSLVYASTSQSIASSPAPSVALDAGPLSAITGTTIHGVTIEWTPTTALTQNQDVFTMTSSPAYALKASPSPTPTPLPQASCEVVHGFTHVALCEVTVDREFRIKFIYGASSNIATSLVTVVLDLVGCDRVFEQHVTGGTVVSFNMFTTKDLVPLTSIAGWTSLSTVAGSDPIAAGGGVSRKFTLPPGKLTPLLVTPELTLHGSTFEGMGTWEQWFGRMVIFSAGGDRWLQISIKKDIWDFNRSARARNAFETLDVVLGVGDVNEPEPGATFVMSNRDFHLPVGVLKLKVTFRSMHRSERFPEVTIGKARRECVDVMGDALHFFICSAPAKEYYGWQRPLSVQFAHLDVAVLEITNAANIDGLLPQLWGVKPLSEENAAYLDEGPAAANGSVNPLPKATGWAGGSAPEDLQMIAAEAKDEAITI